MKIKEGRTLYIRDPDKNYAFVKVGEIAIWRRSYKSIRINGKLYTLTLEEFL
jgi:hypothetical protein